MTYSVSLDEALEVVRVSYSGIVTLNERMQAVENVCRPYSHLKPLKILVNVRELEMHLSIQDQKTFGRFLATHLELKNARVAVLHKNSHNPNLCVDASAYNLGYTRAEFINTKDAEEWLNDR